ncbi:MAG: ATP-binding protein [Bacteroidota bacterium]|nr:ATP-binding protein [Bacteroidota bacterium]
MNTTNSKSIRTNLLFLVLLIFIPFIFIIIFSANQQKSAAKRFAKDNVLRVVRNLGEQQRLIENSTLQFLAVLSQLSDFENIHDTIHVNKFLASLLDQNPSYATLLLVDKNGDLVASGSSFRKLNVSDRKYFKDAMLSKNFAVGEYTRGRLSNKPVLHYAYPILDKQKNVRLILVAGFDLKFYDKLFNTSNLGHDAVFTFVDHNGVIMYHSPNLSVMSGTRESSDIMGILNHNNNKVTFVAKENDNVSRLYAYQCMKLRATQPYMYIYVGVPEKSAYEGYGNDIVINLLVWIAAIVFAMVASFVYTRKYIIKPIDKLNGAIDMVLSGDIESVTGIDSSSSEIGKVARAIDFLTEKLRQREKDSYKTEKELRKLKERFELAINSANIGIWDWHIRNNTLIWDKNMFELFGATPDNFGADYDSWMALIHKDDLCELENEIKRSINYFRPFRSEFRIIHPLFGLRHIRIFADVIKDKAGLPVRLIGVNWDITERKILEGKLHDAKEKAECSDRLKSAFLANISHEIRTPLHGIIGFAQIVREHEITAKDRDQYLDIILNSGNKLLEIISNIIDISLLDARQLKLNEEDINLNSIIQKVYKDFEKQKVKEKKGFSFHLIANFDVNLIVRIDGFRLTQILNNLIDNAFKFTESGQVCFECAVVSNEIRVKIDDTGIGINRKDTREIFDHFRQVEMTYNRSYSGNGLGLSICKGLVELMEGRIVVKPRKDGTAFCLTLPIQKPQDSSLEAKMLGTSYLLS